MRFRKLLAAVATAAVAFATGAQAQQLTVWHDLGDNGIRWFNELNEIYRRTHPNVTITSVSFPTDQWFGRSIAAINSNSAPDLLFNNYERVIRVMTQTNNRILDLSPELAAAGDTSFITEADRRIATYRGRMIIFPVQLFRRDEFVAFILGPILRGILDGDLITLGVGTKDEEERPADEHDHAHSSHDHDTNNNGEKDKRVAVHLPSLDAVGLNVFFGRMKRDRSTVSEIQKDAEIRCPRRKDL